MLSAGSSPGRIGRRTQRHKHRNCTATRWGAACPFASTFMTCTIASAGLALPVLFGQLLTITDREALLARMQAIDPNGIYTDTASEA